MQFNKEAREAFLRFAVDPATPWQANFRDLNAAVIRMATLAGSGRINRDLVDEEIERLQFSWQAGSVDPDQQVLISVLSQQEIDGLDRFDRVQLAEVIRVCRESSSLSQAGRILFSESRKQKANPNDADRLRKYLAKFQLEFSGL